MDSIKHLLFSFAILLLFLPAQLQAQSLIKVSPIDMKKCRDSVKCRTALKKIDKDAKTVEEANEMLRAACCLTDGDRYMLVCMKCDPKTIMHYPSEKFHTDKKKTSSLSSKGDNKLYSILQLKETVSGSLAVFDSLILDIQNMPVIDRNKAQTLHFKTTDSAKKIIHPYFDKQLNVLVIKRDLFESKDNVIISAFYSDDNAEKMLSAAFKLHFANEPEKSELLQIASDLKKVDASLFEDTTVIDYLEDLISGKYERVDDDSFNVWFSQQKY